jgi:hypothetical protein
MLETALLPLLLSLELFAVAFDSTEGRNARSIFLYGGNASAEKRRKIDGLIS